MTAGPRLLAVDCHADDGVLQLAIPADLPCLAGHFPGHPLLPGVVQIGWALDLAARYLGTSLQCRDMEAVKFQHMMQPGQPVTLTLHADRASGKLHFRYHAGDATFSSGRLVLEPAP